VRFEAAGAEHAEKVAALCASEGWETWADPGRTRRALTAPGVSAVVAIDEDEMVGAAHMVSDGSVAAYMAMLMVSEPNRSRGIGRALVAELFARSGARRLDLLAEAEAAPFYRSLRHREFSGFRLYPGTDA
jgi:ribosomal protein S18 acetylase RimI-like enzyme